MKKISVLILTYNNFDFLFDAVNSVANQDYSSIEIILCDDGSDPFPEEMIESISLSFKESSKIDFVVLRSSKNEGTVKNINKGIRNSSGDFIKILAADDYYPSQDIFSKQVECCLNNNKSIVVSKYQDVDDKLNIVNSKRTVLSNKYIPIVLSMDYAKAEKLIRRCDLFPIATQACIYNRSFFDEFGLFNEEYRLIEDVDMSERIRQNKQLVMFLDIVSVCHRTCTGVSRKNAIKHDVTLSVYEQDMLILLRNRYKKAGLLERISIHNDIDYINLRHNHTGFRFIEYQFVKCGHILKSLFVRIRQSLLL